MNWISDVLTDSNDEWAVPEVQPNVATDFEVARHRVFPMLESKAKLELLDVQSLVTSSRTFGQVYSEFTEDTVIGLVYQEDEKYMRLNRRSIDAWGLNFEAVMNQAMQNLRADTSDDFLRPALLDGQPSPLMEGVYGVPIGNVFNSTRILFQDLIEKFVVNGTAIAVTPDNYSLQLLGSKHGLHEAIVEMPFNDRYKQAIENEEFIVCTTPLYLEGGKWRQKEFEGTKMNLEKLSRIYTCMISHKQGNLLARLHEKLGCDIKLGIEVVLSEDDQPSKTMTRWDDGVTLLLTPTELVCFSSEWGPSGKQLGIAPWSRVEEVLGGLLEPVSIFPLRYRTLGFPTREQLQALTD